MAPAVILAQGLQEVLSESSSREALRDILRDSPWTEHTYRIGEIKALPGGSELLYTALAVKGVEGSGADVMLESLRNLDLGIPNGEQRKRWTGGPELVVVPALEEATLSTTGYPVTGGSAPIGQLSRASTSSS
jgi:hypothetical protein